MQEQDLSTMMTTDSVIRPGQSDWRITGCPVCSSRSVDEFFTLRGVPAQDGVLWETPEAAAAAPRGDIQLMFCTECGYIGNQWHDPSKVQFVGYDVSLQHSPLFRRFTEALASKLVERHGLRGKTILDIGCGKGYFLSTLCAMGKNRGIGFDPSYSPPDNGAENQPMLTFIKDYYSPAYAHFAADFISCRHVIDILSDPVGFLSMVRNNIGDRRSVVYFESPDASYTLTNHILWNIVYEHKSWFTLDSYRALFERCGFDVLDVSRCWNNEYLGIEAVPAAQPSSSLHRDRSSIDAAAAACASFAAGYAQTVRTWSERLDELRAEKKNVALWGSGARGISFLNFFHMNDFIRTVIDINPKRQGRYLPLSVQRVEAPECLSRLALDFIIISNPTYEHEIRQQAAQLGYGGEFIVL
jgi:hypothetical protein